MIDQMENLRQACREGKPLKYLFFWGHTQGAGPVTKACLSQWYPSEFRAEGETYRWAEQYMMAQKALLFGDQAVFRQIMEAKNPGQCKKLGRQISPFQAETWDAHKSRIVEAGNLAKFSQNPELKEFLLNTGDRILAEASPYDRIWGIGLAAQDKAAQNPLLWPGQNLLGFALMEVRDRLRRE